MAQKKKQKIWENLGIDYFLSLKPEVQKRYIAKISQINSLDPYTLCNEEFNISIEELPTLAFLDIFVYFTGTHSFYTKQELNAYKSLEAYKYYTDGFVLEIKCSKIDDNFLVIGDVKHSQKMSLKPLKPWIILLPDASISSAHCNCMAGLGEVCSHIAAVCFALCARNEDELSCTDKLCSWNVPNANKIIGPKRIKDINFGKPSTSYSSITKMKIPTLEGDDLLQFLHKVNDIEPEAPILRVIEPFASMRVTKRDPHLPPFLSNLYDEKYSKLTLEELRKINVNMSITEEQADAVFVQTLEQSKKTDWYKYRHGRITASNFKSACRTSVEKPALSTIKMICYSSKPHLKVSKAISYGILNEPKARNDYLLKMTKENHEELQLITPGLVISLKNPEFGASPDGIIVCNCCGCGCVEIKCPLSLADITFEEYVALKNCCLEKKNNTYHLREDHEYYFQVQLQMFCVESHYCDFVIWSQATKNNLFVERISYNEDFMKSNIQKASFFHKNVIIPELLARFYTKVKDSSTIEAWCSCCQPKDDRCMIKCTNEQCEIQMFHLECIKPISDTFNENTWLCTKCLEDKAIEEAVCQYDDQR